MLNETFSKIFKQRAWDYPFISKMQIFQKNLFKCNFEIDVTKRINNIHNEAMMHLLKFYKSPRKVIIFSSPKTYLLAKGCNVQL